jgi:hypothetical protein
MRFESGPAIYRFRLRIGMDLRCSSPLRSLPGDVAGFGGHLFRVGLLGHSFYGVLINGWVDCGPVVLLMGF